MATTYTTTETLQIENERLAARVKELEKELQDLNNAAWGLVDDLDDMEAYVALIERLTVQVKK